MDTRSAGRAAAPVTPTGTHTRTSSTELYEAGFSTAGAHPMGRVAIARTLAEARQRLADMLIFCDPQAPATANICRVPPRRNRRELPGHGRGQLHRGQRRHPGRTVIANPLTSTAAGAATDGQR